jgi:hypothetical protein
MKTSTDVVEEGFYESRCCGYERTFDKHETFQRCPVCLCLCEWDLAEVAVNQKETNQEAA